MQTIFIEPDYRITGITQVLEVEAKSKKDFDRQINRMTADKKITEQWGLSLSSVNHKWFNN